MKGAPVKNFQIAYSDPFQKALKKIKAKDAAVFTRIERQIMKIVTNPFCGKPLRNVLKNVRRVHIDPYVLLYEINQNEVRFLDFDHHDKIYGKH